MRTIARVAALLLFSAAAIGGDRPIDEKTPSDPHETGSTRPSANVPKLEQTPGITPEDRANIEREMNSNILESVEDRLKRLEH